MEFKDLDNKNKAKYTSNMRNFVSSSIVTAVDNQSPNEWKANTSYKVGDMVVSDNKVYIATQNGNSGANKPTHTSGILASGKLSWLFVRNNIASNNTDSNLYLAMGGTKPWEDEEEPPVVNPNDVTMADIKTDLLTLVRLDSTSVRFGLKNNQWIQNSVYDEYDPTADIDDPLSYENGFFVITKDYNIYKCIDNGGGKPSLIEPTGRDINVINTNDGYVWKYMASVERSDISRFITHDYVPISVKTYDDGSDQWKVQENAKNGSIGNFKNIHTNGKFNKTPKYEVIGSGKGCVPVIILNDVGGIDKINTYDGGSGYDEDTYITVFEDGITGSGGEIIATVEEGIISSVEIITGGTDYAIEPSIFIIGDGTGAELEVTINSVDGSINNVNIISGGSGYTFAKIIVVKGTNAGYATAVLSPAGGHGYNVITELGARSIIFSCKNSPEMTPYLLSGSDSTYRQISLLSNVSSTKGITPQLLIGNSHRDYENNSLDKFDVNSGFVLWIDNRTAITRSEQQEEYIKIVLDI